MGLPMLYVCRHHVNVPRTELYIYRGIKEYESDWHGSTMTTVPGTGTGAVLATPKAAPKKWVTHTRTTIRRLLPPIPEQLVPSTAIYPKVSHPYPDHYTSTSSPNPRTIGTKHRYLPTNYVNVRIRHLEQSTSCIHTHREKSIANFTSSIVKAQSPSKYTTAWKQQMLLLQENLQTTHKVADFKEGRGRTDELSVSHWRRKPSAGRKAVLQSPLNLRLPLASYRTLCVDVGSIRE